MKKLLAAMLLTVSCSAFAGIPAGYQDAPAPNENTRVLVNPAKQAVISVAILAEEETPAKAVAEGMVQQLKCNSAVEGNDSQASFENCDVNGQKMNVAIMSGDGKTIMVMANDKATDAEVAEVFAD